MRDAVDILLQIVLAIFGAVFFGTVTVALGALGVGSAVLGGCWAYFGWRKRRESRRRL